MLVVPIRHYDGILLSPTRTCKINHLNMKHDYGNRRLFMSACRHNYVAENIFIMLGVDIDKSHPWASLDHFEVYAKLRRGVWGRLRPPVGPGVAEPPGKIIDFSRFVDESNYLSIYKIVSEPTVYCYVLCRLFSHFFKHTFIMKYWYSVYQYRSQDDDSGLYITLHYISFSLISKS